MRLVYYTFPHLLDPALSFVREMAPLTECHLVLEMEPRSWSPMFDRPPALPRGGVTAAAPVLERSLPPEVQACWREVASFTLVYYSNSQSLGPATLPVSHAALSHLRSLRPDVLHFDDVSLRLALDVFEFPTVDLLSVHDPQPHSGEKVWRTDVPRWFTFRRTRRFLLHNSAQVLPFCADHGVSAERVAVSHLGVPTVFTGWGDQGACEEESHTVLFLGRLSKYKGIECLYRAMRTVARQVPDVRLIVAGRPAFGYHPPTPPDLPGGARIEVRNRHVPPFELACLMQRAALVVCPYTDATQSGVVLAAYAFRKPVVATTVGGLPEYVRHDESGLLVPPNDADALGAAITRLLLDRELRHRLRRGVERLSRMDLSWKARARHMLDIYQRAAERKA